MKKQRRFYRPGCFSFMRSVWLSFLLLSCVTSSQPSVISRFPPVEHQRQANDFRDFSHKGMVVAAHPLASLAGKEMLAKGGNAADAAVAASFVISVVRPQSTGLGGGGFLLNYDQSKRETRVYDFRERAPLAATREMYVDAKGQAKRVFYGKEQVAAPSMNGHLSVAVPGLVKGLLEFHRQHGKLKLADVMAPAIRAAALGFPVYPTLASALDDRRDILKLYPASVEVFFKDGRPLKLGELLVQKDLAKTLTEITEKQEDVFYKGEIAQKIVAEIKRGGGILSAQDLAQYKVRERSPLRSTYHGFSVLTMPPPSSGGVHLVQMLNMLEGDDLKSLGHGTSAYDHLLAEVMRRAYADRATYMGDPDYVNVPVNALIGKSYAKRLRASIKKNRASASMELQNPVQSSNESSSTTHISVVDQWGNAVSTTQTINYSFGSCVVVPETGIVLNDEMDDFAATPGKPNAFGLIQGEANAVAAGKTPLSSMTPTILLTPEGTVAMVLGSPGGPKIINAVLQTIVNVVDFKMPLLDAVHAYRIHHQWLPDQISYETEGLTQAEKEGLNQYGHRIVVTRSIGEVSAILRNSEGGWEGVADPRAEGKPAGL